MGNPWEIYDTLINAIPEEVTLTTVNVGAQWTRVINSAGGAGMAGERTSPVRGFPTEQ